MLEKIKARLTDDARCWYKMWSSWLAGVWGLIVLVFWNSPEILNELLGAMPQEVRAWLSPIVLGLAAGLPIVVRLIKQRKLAPPSGE